MPSLPLRPRCDVPPFKAIAAELAKRKAREPSERGKVLREAYREYAAKAARPYAFRPFCQQFNLWEQRRFEEEVEAHKVSDSFWEGGKTTHRYSRPFSPELYQIKLPTAGSGRSGYRGE